MSDIEPKAVEDLLDAAFGADRFGRTAYRIREGVDAIPQLSFALIDDGALFGTIQCWPVALTDPAGRAHPMIMVGPVAVLPEHQGMGYGQALMTASLSALSPDAPLPQVMIGDPEYYGRFWGFTNAYTGGWDLPGPFEQHRLLVRCANPAVLPKEGMLGPWRG